MKLSRYNIIKKFGNTNIAFNALTCALAVVNKDFMDIIDSIEKSTFNESYYPKELVKNMQNGGYIIDDEVNEVERINFFRNREKYSGDSLALTIAPTLECNFKCVYCYETPEKGIISQEVQDAIYSFIAKRIKGVKAVAITWYGGEPLLAKKVIYDLSSRIVKLCEENLVEYNAFIITNASLMTSEDVALFKKAKIHGAQVTIDGPKEIHDSRRISKNGQSTYDMLIANVDRLLKEDFRVIVRINVDKGNLETVDLLLAELKERLSAQEKLNIDFGQVSPFTEVCKSIESSCFDNEQYADILIPLYQKVMEYGFTMNKMSVYPKLRLNYCCTDYLTSFVVDQRGDLYKCWNDVGNHERRSGTIFDETPENSFGNIKWVEHNPLKYGKCRECNILPICMGGCPHKIMDSSNEPICDSIKYNIDKVLEYYYQTLKECE